MIKSISAKIFAMWSFRKSQKWIKNPIQAQEKVLRNLIRHGSKTIFGKQHQFQNIQNLKSFQTNLPIRDYEGFRPYIDIIMEGGKDILWPGRPIYFAKSSGTTSGIKFIPITKASMPNHIKAAREAILNYIYETGNTSIVYGKHIFVQGSPVLENKNDIALGRLSGIVAHYVPSYLQKNKMPSWETNCIDDWEAKVEAIVSETEKENMTIIGGIPSWIQMYFERLINKTGKKVGQLFPNFKLFIYGGVNFEPYRRIFEKLVGRSPDSIEFYPASEGFFAYQDRQNDRGLLLLLDHGIYYEFILANKFLEKNPQIFTLAEVELGENYVMIISTSAGLWRYNIGDTIQFTSTYPFRVIVSGRLNQFISAFGEHVIVSEVEQALKEAIDYDKADVRVREFTVAPQVKPAKGLPFHEWFIEFENPPKDLKVFAKKIDEAMQEKNIYYNDLITGKVLSPLIIRLVVNGGFISYMKSIGKLGGQNKVPRVSDNRKIVNVLKEYLIKD